MEMAIIGLGKMGKELAGLALKKGVRVVGHTLGEIPEALKDEGLVAVHNLAELIQQTSRPRKIFLYVPAGQVVEGYISKFSQILDEGDIVIDGGNSYWGDSIRRQQILGEKKINFLDMGTSGGIPGARTGACFMVGGEKESFEKIAPILEQISAPDAFAYIGPSGSGHLVKLIHNGMEFGMLQAIGEGMALLERYREEIPFDIKAVFKTYRNGSVIRSWLIDLMAEQYAECNGLKEVSAYIEDTGEVNWLLADALHLEVPLPVITQSVLELFRSRDEKRDDYKSVAMMRHGFGGHPFGPFDYFKTERRESRIRPEFPEERL